MSSSIAATWAHHWEVLRESWALETERRRGATRWRETDFLPAALEAVETPPNPLGTTILWTLMALVGFALGWSILAYVDVVAVADGKLVAEGRNAIVQAADGGVVRAIHVRDGQSVKAGQALLSLDPTTTGADRAQAEAALLAARLDRARALGVLDGLRGGTAGFVAPPGLPEAVAAAEARLVRERVAGIRAKLGTLAQQAAEARAEEDASRHEAARLQDTLPLLDDRVARRKILADKGLSSRLLQLELEQQRIDHQRRITIEADNGRRAAASAAGVIQQLALAKADAAREALDELSKAETEIRQREEELLKAEQRSRQQVLFSPVAGTVQQLGVTTIGAVLKPADPILVVVPDDARLVVEARVLNRDAGFVREGQPVTVKLEAFPFTRYGTVPGRLVRISRDAVQDEKLGPIYEARVAIDQRTIDADGRRVVLSPGLTATAEIKTGTRRVIDFLLSPLERRLAEAGRER